jgi:hypothetical protein
LMLPHSDEYMFVKKSADVLATILWSSVFTASKLKLKD